MKIFVSLMAVIFVGCAQMTSLGMKKHEFGTIPSKIIWFQIAGLSEEHLAMMKYGQNQGVLSFEKSLCIGKTWNYNLYHLRNSSQVTFLSQMSGSKNIKQDCTDSKIKPIWNYLKDSGYVTAILESQADENQRLVSYLNCQGSETIDFKNISYWTRESKLNSPTTYFPGETIQKGKRGQFLNRSCQNDKCLSTIGEDFLHVEKVLSYESKKYLFIIRDFSYLNSLKRNNFKEAKDRLEELTQMYQYALNDASDSDDYLILLTTSEGKQIQFPKEGKEWYDFEKSKYVPSQSSSLMNFTLAAGSRSENFCGFYDDSQILDRILSGPKQQGLELKFINPFR